MNMVAGTQCKGTLFIPIPRKRGKQPVTSPACPFPAPRCVTGCVCPAPPLESRSQLFGYGDIIGLYKGNSDREMPGIFMNNRTFFVKQGIAAADVAQANAGRLAALLAHG